MTADKLSKPKASAGDVAHSVAKAGLSAIPVVGGPAAEIFGAVIIPPLTKRRDEWVESIVEKLKALEEKVEGFKIESLQNNEAFVSAAMHATQIAIRNHHQEKREALRNAVVNVAIGNAPDEDLQLMFLNFIDTLTPWHLRLLRFFRDPPGYGAAKGVRYPSWSMGAPNSVLEITFDELRGRRSFYDQVVNDLHSRGLMNTDASSMHTMMTASGMFAKRTTETGDLFLAFTTSSLKE